MYDYIHQAVTNVRRGVSLIYQLILKTNTEVLVYLDLFALVEQVRSICWQPCGVIFFAGCFTVLKPSGPNNC